MNDIFLVVIIALAILLLTMEVAIVPGFTYFGILGILLLGVSTIYAFLNHSLVWALIILISSLIVVIAFITWFFKKGIHRGFSLKGNESKLIGYKSYKEDYEQFIGKSGIAHSSLRPAGFISINDFKLSAVSQGDYIEAGEKVRVVKVEGTKLIVKKIQD
jgi:membrane-bound serine protease (ClpP class)